MSRLREKNALPGSPAFQRDLLVGRVRNLYLQAPVSNVAVIAIAVLAFVLLRDRVDLLLLSSWSALMAGTAGLRLLLWRAHRRAPLSRTPHFWLYSYAAASMAVGISWGLVHFLHDYSDGFVLLVLVMTTLGVLSSAVAVLSPQLPTFFLYSGPLFLLFCIGLLRHADPETASLLIGFCSYQVMLTLFARNTHGQFLDAQRLIFENQELVHRLNQEIDQREDVIRARTTELEESNEALEHEVREREQAEEALRAQQKSLRDMAHHDALTGLPNRLLLTDRLSQAIARADREPALLGVLFVDLDHFKQINDSLGHSVGDALLKSVAKRLIDCVRKGDTVARLGGDEFILLLHPLQHRWDARQLAEKLLAALSLPFQIDGRAFRVSASVGISLYPDDGEDPETLLRNADAAMYRAKEHGRSDYRFYSAEMTEQALGRLAIEADLARALEEEQLELYFQPQICLTSQRVVAAEALLRWNHPTRGLVLPDTFIPIAEQSALINRIGNWVLRAACRQLRAWQDAGLENFVLSLNLSGREVWNNPLLDNFDRAIADAGCSAQMLELEITESFLIQQADEAKQLLAALRERGVRVAVDDFGTGYSSLAYLKHYPINKLKIDRSFVRDIGVDPDDQSIVRAIVALGRSLDLSVTGEGVETEDQADFLRGEGCDLAQGFLYGAAMPIAAFNQYLADQGACPPAIAPTA